MVPDGLREFFAAAAGVSGALIGLLFVAITVASERLARRGAQVNRIRASAALTAFTNPLVVSLLALIPTQTIGPTSVAVAGAGIVFVIASLISLVREHMATLRALRDVLFLAALVVVLVVQLIQGVKVIINPDNTAAINTIALLVTICFLIGIDRAWELVGGPSIGLGSELTALLRARKSNPDEAPQEGPTNTDR